MTKPTIKPDQVVNVAGHGSRPFKLLSHNKHGYNVQPIDIKVDPETGEFVPVTSIVWTEPDKNVTVADPLVVAAYVIERHEELAQQLAEGRF